MDEYTDYRASQRGFTKASDEARWLQLRVESALGIVLTQNYRLPYYCTRFTEADIDAFVDRKIPPIVVVEGTDPERSDEWHAKKSEILETLCLLDIISKKGWKNFWIIFKKKIFLDDTFIFGEDEDSDSFSDISSISGETEPYTDSENEGSFYDFSVTNF